MDKRIFIVVSAVVLVFVFAFMQPTDQVLLDYPGTITVPIHVHIVDGSSRDAENAKLTVNQSNRILSQAGVRLEIADIDKAPGISTDRNILARGNPFPADPERIDVYFAQYIGANGVSFSPDAAVFVADPTTVNDYRTLAHEIGHVLGLHHAGNIEFLMYQGSNGEFLRSEEIATMRRNAARFVS